MENEIKVNEYIRTTDGKIGIFVRYSSRKDDSIYKSPFNCFIRLQNRKSNMQCCREYIVKHSPELLDLIKAEDVIKIKTGLYSSFMHFVVDEDDLIYIKAQMEAGFWIIDKIYTKEMMESISYKVERKD